MPNAKDMTKEGAEKILILGDLGVGKTTQFVTLPRPAFIYIFDPSGRNAIKGQDIEYEEYLAEKLNITVKATPKGGGTVASPQQGVTRLKAQAYAQFEEHFMESLDSGRFDKFASIGFDSITTFSDIAMDDILARAGRLEYNPELGDHNILKTQVARTLRALCALNKILLVTAHTMYRQNDVSMKMMNDILITGDLQVRAPLLFSSVLRADYEVQPGDKRKFTVQSVKDKYSSNLKSNIPGIKGVQDVTIEDFSKPQDYGIGKLLREGR